MREQHQTLQEQDPPVGVEAMRQSVEDCSRCQSRNKTKAYQVVAVLPVQPSMIVPTPLEGQGRC